MKARVIQDNYGFYTGEIYTTWINPLSKRKWEGWRRVTCQCMTKLGAKHEIKEWKKKNCPEEFEI